MLALIYQWRILPGREENFIYAWTRMTEIIREREGSWGSRLHRTEDGRFIAYAQWPSREAWDASDLIPDTSETEHLRTIMNQSAERILPDTMMTMVEDRLLPVFD